MNLPTSNDIQHRIQLSQGQILNQISELVAGGKIKTTANEILYDFFLNLFNIPTFYLIFLKNLPK